MTSELPVLKPRQVVQALEKAGFERKRQTSNHVILYKLGLRRPISVPQHPQDMPNGTLRAIIREAGLTVNEFLTFL